MPIKDLKNIPKPVVLASVEELTSFTAAWLGFKNITDITGDTFSRRDNVGNIIRYQLKYTGNNTVGYSVTHLRILEITFPSGRETTSGSYLTDIYHNGNLTNENYYFKYKNSIFRIHTTSLTITWLDGDYRLNSIGVFKINSGFIRLIDYYTSEMIILQDLIYYPGFTKGNYKINDVNYVYSGTVFVKEV